MAKLEAIDEPRKLEPKTAKKKIKPNKFFVFVDYLFLLIFFAFLSFILLKMLGTI